MNLLDLLKLLALTLGSALICAGILWSLLRSGRAKRWALDQPNARSLHTQPTPRCGGLGVVVVVLLVAALGLPHTVWLMLGLFLLALLSWQDDRGGVPIRWRLFGHALAALLIVWSLLPMPVGIALLALVAIVWGTNLFNFMDGANGMSAAMLVAGFATYAVAAASKDRAVAAVAASLSGAGAGFWLFNRTPARLFLGDVGSIPAGFAMGAIGLSGWRTGLWPGWFPWLVFSPFVADATVTLLRRSLRREAIWRAHRQHFYQRLVQSGATHSTTSTLWFVLMLGSSALALFLRDRSAREVALGLAADGLLLTVVALWIERRYQRSQHARA